jgi:hypothetical protein
LVNELREERKVKILMLAQKEQFPLTAPKVEEELDINYPTALSLLFELAVEGKLLLKKGGWAHQFVLNTEKFLPKRAVILTQ